MIIDFHTHIFPDRIASKTISLLSEKAGISPFSDGTVEGLLARMEESGVDLSVTLPVLTAPAQFESVNRFAAEINARFADAPRRLISFAGIHPQCEDIEGKMQQIRDSGFLGVKIHPDYQQTFINDEGYVRILQAAKELDLIVVTHAGVDVGYPDAPVRCTPALAKEVIERVRHPKLVLAHCGASEMFDEVCRLLCGLDVYLDTAYVLRFIGKDMFQKIIKKHGADRLLFASDSPWSSQREDLATLRSFGLTPSEEKQILSANAMRLLGIREGK